MRRRLPSIRLTQGGAQHQADPGRHSEKCEGMIKYITDIGGNFLSALGDNTVNSKGRRLWSQPDLDGCTPTLLFLVVVITENTSLTSQSLCFCLRNRPRRFLGVCGKMAWGGLGGRLWREDLLKDVMSCLGWEVGGWGWYLAPRRQHRELSICCI